MVMEVLNMNVGLVRINIIYARFFYEEEAGYQEISFPELTLFRNKFLIKYTLKQIMVKTLNFAI
jgi:hypothetical protein